MVGEIGSYGSILTLSVHKNLSDAFTAFVVQDLPIICTTGFCFQVLNSCQHLTTNLNLFIILSGHLIQS